jgi:N2227-like protein
MVAAMRTIIDDILPYMSTDTDNDTASDSDSDSNKERRSGLRKNADSDVHSNTDTDTDTNSNNVNNADTNIHEAEKTLKGSDRDRINTSHNTQNGTLPLFEFYPHISPKLADSWDFKSTLEAVTFPSNDSANVANWLKRRRKHDISQNRMSSNPVSEEEDVRSMSGREQSGGSKEGCEIKRDRGEFSAAIIGDGSPVPTPAHVPTSTPVPIPVPVAVPTSTHTPIPVPSLVPTPSLLPVSTPAPVSDPTPIPVLTPAPETASPYPLGSLSIQMGEFTKVYSHIDQENQFDCVVTCFFIDTATDILEYLAVIAHVLREGTYNFLIYFSIV